MASWTAVETFSRLLQQAMGSTEGAGAAAPVVAAEGGGDDTEMTEEEVGLQQEYKHLDYFLEEQEEKHLQNHGMDLRGRKYQI